MATRPGRRWPSAESTATGCSSAIQFARFCSRRYLDMASAPRGTSRLCGWDAPSTNVGLTAGFDHPTTSFEYVSASVAKSLTLQNGWTRSRVDSIERAIVAHMAREVDLGASIESRLLSEGVSCAVTGRRIGEISEAHRKAVARLVPRCDFKTGFSTLMEQEAGRKPAGAASALVAHGLVHRIANSPFDDTPTEEHR